MNLPQPQPSEYERVKIFSLVKDEDGSISKVPMCLCELCRVNHFICPRYARHSSAGEAVLDQIEKIVSGRIAELKSWIKLAQINQDRKRELEILPILGENQALWAQIQELRQQGERDRG